MLTKIELNEKFQKYYGTDASPNYGKAKKATEAKVNHVPNHMIDYTNGRFICPKCNKSNCVPDYRNNYFYGDDFSCGHCREICHLPRQTITARDNRWLNERDVIEANRRSDHSSFFAEGENRSFGTKVYDAEWSNFYNAYIVTISDKSPNGRQYRNVLLYLNGGVDSRFLPDDHEWLSTLNQARKQREQLLELDNVTN